VIHALFGAQAPSLDDTMEALADFIQLHFEPGALESLIR
jgi:adenosylcobyric acid synthase